MEVRVETAEGFELPQGCYVGVRVGDVLKQGRYEPQRCYHFPSLERRRNAKIDVYKHVGFCIVGVDPEAKSQHLVNVTSSDPTISEMKLKVNVQTTGVDAAKQRETRTKAVKSQAKDYLSKYNIEEKLSDAVKALLKEQPDDPTGFLCRHLMEGGSLAPSPVNAAPKAPKAQNQMVAAGKPKTQAAIKPFKGYYSGNMLPNVTASAFQSIYSKFPAAAKHLQPTPGTASTRTLPKDGGKVPAIGIRSLDIKALPDHKEQKAVAKSGPAESQEDLSGANFKYRPSVGTWLTKPIARKKVQVFNKLPSVGTWLSPAPEPGPEPPKPLLMPNNFLMGSSGYSLGMPVNTMRMI
jgi:hypothetical protein